MKARGCLYRAQNLWLAMGMVVVCALGMIAQAQDQVAADTKADLSVTYSPHLAEFSCNMNMGPTGATAWMRGYQFVVTSIQQQSPASQTLKLGDVVTGTEKVTFGPEADPRMTLGNAIGQAHATGEPLKLRVLRQGKPVQIAIDLPKFGAYASTWPASCAKSSRILDDACRSLVESQLPNGRVVTDGDMGTFLSGLLFLGSNDSRYLDPARRAAYYATTIDYANHSLNNWAMGYGGLLMAEYYLATGDDTVLPKLQEVATRLAAGQMRCGTWGHSSPAGGYGAMNQPGNVCTMTLVLAQQCGLEVDNAAIRRSLNFLSRFVATGAVPYGDHHPTRSLDDNGKSASAAVLFHLAGRDAEAKIFAASVAESYWLREEGHTGGFFSMVWGPLGASLAGEAKLRKFLDYQKWYYDLARQWTGGITMQPFKEALTRFDDSSYIYFGGDFTTGGMGLVYALPQKKLRILGAGPSVFGAILSGDLRTARDLYVARRWQDCDKLLATIDPATLGSDQDRAWLAQLRAAREITRQSTDRVLMEIDCNLQDGAAYRASQQYEALKRCLGEDADARFADLDKRLADGNTTWYIREGQQYYEQWEGMVGYTIKSWVPQGLQAKKLLQGLPSLRLPIWEPLSPVSQVTPQPWRSMLAAPDQSLPAGWEQPGFDDSAWHSGEGIRTRFNAPAGGKLPNGPIAARRTFTVDHTHGRALRVRVRTVRPAVTKVYLNGTLIVNIERGQRGGYAEIPLDKRVFDLLKQGENVLAVTSDQQGDANNALDVGLEIDRNSAAPRYLPIERLAAVDSADLPDVDTSLHVGDTTEQFRAALKQSYADQSIEQLLKELHTVIGYYRELAEQALADKGLDAVKAAAALHDDSDWKVRAAVMSVIANARSKFEKEQNQAGLDYLLTLIPMVARHVSDEHFWVRTQACEALAGFGELARSALPELIKGTNDSMEWVRQASLVAVQRIGADPATIVQVTQQALDQDNTAFDIARRAVSIARQPGGSDSEKLAMLVKLLRDPPEGGGGAFLSQAIDIACGLDPDGKVMIPLLTDAAADKTHLSRQRGNPRGKAIEALGNYGVKAVSAVTTLKAILADDSDAGKQHHEAAQAALKAITG